MCSLDQTLVVPLSEQLCDDAASSPEVNFDSIIGIAVEELRGSIVPRGDVSDTSRRQITSRIRL